MPRLRGLTDKQTCLLQRPAARLFIVPLLAFVVLFGTTMSAEELAPAEFVDRYCVQCHGASDPESDLRLDSLDDLSQPSQRHLWWEVWTKVHEGEMPPEDEPQPTATERENLLQWIKDTHGQPADRADHWSFKPVLRPPLPTLDEPPAHPIDAFIMAKLGEHRLTMSPPADRRTLIRRASLVLTGLPPSPQLVGDFLRDADATPLAFARVVDRLLASNHYGERWAQHWLDIIRWAETVGFETNLERQHAWHYRDWIVRALNDDLPYDQFISQQLLGDILQADAALGFLVSGPANLPGQIGRDEEAMRQARQDELDEVIRTVSQSLFGLTIGCARCHDHKFDPISQRDYYAMQAVFAGLKYGTRRLRGSQNDEWASRVPLVEEKLALFKSQLAAHRHQLQLREPLNDVQTERFTPILAKSVRMEIADTTGGPPSLYEFEILSVDGSGASTNVALASNGAKPSASSFALANQTRHFENLIDGSIDQRQAFPWVAARDGPAWLQIDLATPVMVDRIVWHKGSSVPADYEIRVRSPGNDAWRMVAHARDRLPRRDDLRDAKHVRLDGVKAEQIAELVSLQSDIRRVESELKRLRAGPQTYAASFSDRPAETRLLRRGDPMQPTDVVTAATPMFLLPTEASDPESEVDRRRGLVKHLIDPRHPLTARVMVNRVWQHHFGMGLVETASDFGNMGAQPTHPQLLDWLASEFVTRGWSLKQLHRVILTSRVFQQSSLPRSQEVSLDAETRLLWRYPPRRLDAEAIRDSILVASGRFNAQMYGRGFDFFNQRGGLSDYRAKEAFDASGWRRMLYAHKVRMQAIDVFGAFDCPDAGQMTPRRNQSVTPIQSLGLLNSTFVNRQAGFFSERVVDEAGDLAASIALAYDIALSRRPNQEELAALRDLGEEHGIEQVARLIFNLSEFVFIR